MPKKLVFFLVIMVISNSIFIFFYGISQQIKASKYESEIKRNLLFDSAVILALHKYEDTGRPDIMDGSFPLYKWKFKYLSRELGDNHLYINITGLKKGTKTEKEYLLTK